MLENSRNLWKRLLRENKFISGNFSWRMLKDDARFVLIGFEFPELEGKNFKHNFPLVGDQILKVRKFQNSMKEVSKRMNSFWKMLKDYACFILIGFQFPELEGKNHQLNIDNNDKWLNVHMFSNYIFLLIKDEVVNEVIKSMVR